MMFYYIEGNVGHIEAGLAVIDCWGVGYALNVTANTLSRLKKDERAKLYVYSVIREDCFDLYGFYSINEKHSFELLLGVSGVGPKAAISILSLSSPENLAIAIIGGDEKTLTMAPGIGKKMAQRIILELRDKIDKETSGINFARESAGLSPIPSGKLNDAVAALSVLGYTNAEISVAIKDIDMEGSSLEEIIRTALRKMVK